MKFKSLVFLLILPLIFVTSCDEDPTRTELILAHPWRVDNYNFQASAGGITISNALLEPYIDDIVAQAPLNGIITFDASTFSIDDQGTILEGTWSLSSDESELTMIFTLGSQSFTFEIVKVTADEFNLKYTIEQSVEISDGNFVTVNLEITAFLVPV